MQLARPLTLPRAPIKAHTKLLFPPGPCDAPDANPSRPASTWQLASPLIPGSHRLFRTRAGTEPANDEDLFVSKLLSPMHAFTSHPPTSSPSPPPNPSLRRPHPRFFILLILYPRASTPALLHLVDPPPRSTACGQTIQSTADIVGICPPLLVRLVLSQSRRTIAAIPKQHRALTPIHPLGAFGVGGIGHTDLGPDPREPLFALATRSQ